MSTLFDELSKHLFPSSDRPKHKWSIIKEAIDQARKCRPDLIKLLKCKDCVLESLCKPGTVSKMSDNLKRLLPQINQNAGAQHIREQLIANYFIPDFSLIHALAQGLFDRIKVWELDTLSTFSMFSRQCTISSQLKKDKIVPILSSLRLSETAEAQKNKGTRLNKILLKPEHLNGAKKIHSRGFSEIVQGNIFIRFVDKTNLEEDVRKSINTIISQMEKNNIIPSLVEKLDGEDLLLEEALNGKGITTTNESAKLFVLSIANTLIEKIESISSNIDCSAIKNEKRELAQLCQVDKYRTWLKEWGENEKDPVRIRNFVRATTGTTASGNITINTWTPTDTDNTFFSRRTCLSTLCLPLHDYKLTKEEFISLLMGDMDPLGDTFTVK